MLAFAAIVIDRVGRIVAMTAAADYIARTGEFIATRQGRIEGITANDTIAINNAIRTFMETGYHTGHSQTFLLAGTKGNIANVQIAPLLRSQRSLDGAVAIMGIEPLETSARALSRLTAAETEVAIALLAGWRATEIACERNVSVETVRSQIKSIYAKFDVKGHVEFIAAVHRER